MQNVSNGRFVKTLNFKEFENKGEQKFEHKFIYLGFTINEKTKRTEAKILCPDHGVFYQDPNKHLNQKHGCLDCFIESQRLPLKEILERFAKIFENHYLYPNIKKEYTGRKSFITCFCVKHQIFTLQMVDAHLDSQHACHQCQNYKYHTKETFLQDSLAKFGNQYNYDNINYVNNLTGLYINCPTHGDFYKVPVDHISKKEYGGCMHCSMALKPSVFFERCNDIHDGFYDYSETKFLALRDFITIICPEHGKFTQRARCHLSGQGCRFCSHSSSKKEKAWLISLNIPQECWQFPLTAGGHHYKVDAFFNGKVHEFYGDFWHGHSSYNFNEFNKVRKLTFGELNQRTMEREKIIKTAGYEIITMWEHDWDIFAKTL